jgi:hypothetical protein
VASGRGDQLDLDEPIVLERRHDDGGRRGLEFEAESKLFEILEEPQRAAWHTKPLLEYWFWPR